MKLKGLKRKTKKRVKILVAKQDLIGIRDYLISRELYDEHNRSELLYEALLAKDYKSAEELVEENSTSEFEYEIIATLGDENVFSQALHQFEDYQAGELSLCFIKNVKKAYMPEEKILQIVAHEAFNAEFLKKLCGSDNTTLFDIFIDKCVHWRNDGVYVWATDFVIDLLIEQNIFSLLKILLEKTSLDEQQVNKLNDDQFAYYVGKYPIQTGSLKKLVRTNQENKFKALIRSQNLSAEQLEVCLFCPDRFHFFRTYVDEKTLPEKLERRLFRKGMKTYRQAYLMRHEIGFWKRMEYFLNAE